MHNRVRMITASFLTKDLHVWWPVGARHFLDHLVDGDIASNNHGWQWVAGTGTDASPYFRVFNPVTQGQKFDPDGDYVRRWVPELAPPRRARRRTSRGSTTTGTTTSYPQRDRRPRRGAQGGPGAATSAPDGERSDAERPDRGGERVRDPSPSCAPSSTPPCSSRSRGPARRPARGAAAAARRRRRHAASSARPCSRWALRIPPGDPLFYTASIALAAVWGVGAIASGPLHFGRGHTRSGERDARPIVQSLALGALLLVVFLVGALVVARVPVLREPVDAAARPRPLRVPARRRSRITVVNGIAEELYFRGALYAALPRHAVAITTVLYALTTVGSGIPLLVLAAAIIGLVTALQRRVTGGILGPIITHVTWSTGMLLLLPTRPRAHQVKHDPMPAPRPPRTPAAPPWSPAPPATSAASSCPGCSTTGWTVRVLTRRRGLDGRPAVGRPRRGRRGRRRLGATTCVGRSTDVDAAWYLVHSMDDQPDFAASATARPRRTFADGGRATPASRASSTSAACTRTTRCSRRTSPRASRSAGSCSTRGVPTAVLQAAVVLGDGSASFDMLRYLTTRLPAMVAPKWLDNRIQPIADRRRRARCSSAPATCRPRSTAPSTSAAPRC